jgi:hypothetical protein
LFLAARSIFYVTATTPTVDSGVFLSVARHLQAGKNLYTEVWDHKPPLVHLTNLLAVNLSSDLQFFRIIESVLAVFGTGGIIIFSLVIFQKRFFGAVLGVLYLFFLYSPSIFERGNFTEEYGAHFLAIGMGMLAMFFRESGVPARNLLPTRHMPNRFPESFSRISSWFFLMASALSFGLAPFYKEVFVLSIFPWILYLFWFARGVSRKVAVVCAVSVPGILILMYLIRHDALFAWFDVLSYNFSSTGTAGQSLREKMLANVEVFQYRIVQRSLALYFLSIVGGGFVVYSSLRQRKITTGLMVLASFLGAYTATGLSGRGYGHYYLQAVPCYVLLGYGIHCILTIPSSTQHRLRLNYRWVFLSAIFFLLLLHDRQQIAGWIGTLGKPYRPYQISDISQAATEVLQNYDPAEHVIWAPQSDFTWIYYETGFLSPQKHHFFFNHLLMDSLLSTKEEKLEELKETLDANKPTLFVCTPDKEVEIVEFFLQNFGQHYAYQAMQFGDRKVLFFLLQEESPVS